MQWPALANGKVFVWAPLPGLDPGLGEKACWIGAAVYAKQRASGSTEAVAQMEAEREAIRFQYKC